MSQNITHRAFELMPIVEKLPLQIECLTAFNTTLIIGTNVGQILIYIINLNPSNHKLEITLERTIKSFTKKSIQQLEALQKYSILIALYDSQIHVYDLNTYQHKYTLQKSKGAYSFTTQVTSNGQLIHLCVVCKRKLQFYYINNSIKNAQFMELINDLELNDTPKAIEFVKENLIIFSLRKDYYSYELPSPQSLKSTTMTPVSSNVPISSTAGGSASSLTNAQTASNSQIKELFTFGEKNESTVNLRSMEPICAKVNAYELNKQLVLIAYEDRKCALLEDNLKPRLTYQVQWSSNPSVVCNVGPYLVGLMPLTNTVEVLTIEPKSIQVQTVEFPSSSGSSAGSSSVSSSLSSSSFLAGVANVTSNIVNVSSSLTSSTMSTLASASAAITGTGTGGNNNNAPQVQQAVNVNTADRLKILTTNGNSIFYITTQSNVWGLIPIEVNEQLDGLIKYHNYDIGINLINSYNAYQQLNEQAFIKSGSGGGEQNQAHNRLQPFLNLKLFQVKINPELIVKIKNLDALDSYCQKQFEKSMKQFEVLNTDPTCIIAFISGLLPDSHRMQLIQYRDFKLPDLNSQETKQAIDYLIDYLNYKRKEILKDFDISSTSSSSSAAAANQSNTHLQLYSLNDFKFITKSRKQILEIIDTTLLQAYLRTREQLVQNLLRRENTFFHLETSERLLKAQNKYLELIILYEKKQLHERALVLLSDELNKTNSPLNNISHIIKYLKKLTNKHIELIFKYSKQLVEKYDYKVSLQIFLTNVGLLERINEIVLNSESFDAKKKSSDTNNDDDIDEEDYDEHDQILRQLDRERVCKFFQTQIEPSELGFNLLFKYLEYCVYVWYDKSEYINNLLIQVYKERLDSYLETNNINEYKRLKDKLLKFLTDTHNYQINYALSNFSLNSEERAILLGKLGQHEDALHIYVDVLNDTQKAELYCKNVYMNPSYKNSKNVYYQLLKMYLNSEIDDIRINSSIKLLNEHSNKIATCHTLEMLPAESIKCKNLANFFENMLNKLCRQQRHYQILKHLTFQLNLQVHELRIMKQQTKFIVNEEKLCQICKKRLGKSAIVRYPDGRIIHYGCRKDADVFES